MMMMAMVRNVTRKSRVIGEWVVGCMGSRTDSDREDSDRLPVPEMYGTKMEY